MPKPCRVPHGEINEVPRKEFQRRHVFAGRRAELEPDFQGETDMPTEARPTTRAMIEPSRLCFYSCKMCYHRFSDKQSVKPWPQVRAEIDAAVARGDNACDVTGGEPMIYPEIVELTRYCRAVGLPARIITSGLSGPERTQAVIDAGVESFLISMHGMAETHDDIFGVPGARAKQERFIGYVDRQVPWDANCVMLRQNQSELHALAAYMLNFKPHPRFVNFINMNLHGPWAEHRAEAEPLLADLNILGAELNHAAFLLDEFGVGVTIRYFPVCKLANYLRPMICNDRQVAFDPREWSYDIGEKTVENFAAWGRRASEHTEEQGEPCCRCGLHHICGGMHAVSHRVSREIYGEQLTPEPLPGGVDPEDYYHYRRHATTL